MLTYAYFIIITLLTLPMMVMLPNQASAELSDLDKSEIETLIESYITANPEQIRDVLTSLAQSEQQLRKEAALSLLRDDKDDPVIGPDIAEVTIYEFSDYNCGYCKSIFPTLKDILSADNKVKLVIKEYPILAQSSITAARAAIAAHRQGKFTQFHTHMMTLRGQVDDHLINSAASQAGIDLEQMRADMADPSVDLILARNRRAAAALNIKGTPALVIGNNLVPGVISRQEILDLIMQAKFAKNS